MSRTKVIVIGAGAAGLMAAAAASENGAQVVLLERNDRIGRKLNATGNGRGNIANARMDDSCYRTEEPDELDRVIREIRRDEVLRRLERRGVLFHERQGYIYPRTDYAGTITECLENWILENGVELRTGTEATGISRERSRFLVNTKSREIPGKSMNFAADSVVLTTGGMAGPRFGCDGSGYRLAQSLGHSCTAILPSLTFLGTEDRTVRFAAGVRCYAGVSLSCSGRDGRMRVVSTETGELQINRDSLSGIPVFQLSRAAGRALRDGKRTAAIIDFLPEFEMGQKTDTGRKEVRLLSGTWESVLCQLRDSRQDLTVAQWLGGLVHPKIAAMLSARAGCAAESKIRKLSQKQRELFFSMLRGFEVPVTSTGTFEDCQVTAGGIRLSEIGERFSSRICPSLFLAGEILDADGRCGGYNLTFAMSSGWTAGLAASENRKKAEE